MFSQAPLLIRNKAFCLLWLGQVLSQSGSRMFQIAALWWLMETITHQVSFYLGIFLIIASLPAIILVKLIGKIVEKYSFKSLIIIAEIMGAWAVALAALYLKQNSEHLVIVLMILGGVLATMQAVINPALNKALPQIVNQKDMTAAVALQTSTLSLANFGGAVAGAGLINFVGTIGVAWVNAASYLVSAFLLMGIFVKPSQNNPPNDRSAKQEKATVFSHYPMLAQILAGFAIINFFSIPTLISLPLYVKHALSASADLLAGLEALLWAGLLLGTFVQGRHTQSKDKIHLGPFLILAMGGFLIVPGFSKQGWSIAVGLFGCGFFLGLLNVTFVNYFQKSVRQEHLGRFFALLHAITSASFPPAYFLFGSLGSRVSPPSLFLIQGLGIILASGYMAWILRQLVLTQETTPTENLYHPKEV